MASKDNEEDMDQDEEPSRFKTLRKRCLKMLKRGRSKKWSPPVPEGDVIMSGNDDEAAVSSCVCLRYNTQEKPKSIKLQSRELKQEEDLDSLERSSPICQTRMANMSLEDALRSGGGNGGSGLLNFLHFDFSTTTNRSAQVHAQIDYTNFLIPGQRDIIHCPFYWGKIDRYEAEELLADKPEGSFLLRDSAQDDFVFSVSFRRYSRSLHARIEEDDHLFSFDSHDPGVHCSYTIRQLLEHYKDPLSCMFFEPMLLFPVVRKTCFSLQNLARATICDHTTYGGVSKLPIPKVLKQYLREYHYKHKIRTRYLDPSICSSN